MGKKNLVGLMIVSSMLLVACGSGDEAEEDKSTEEETEQVDEEVVEKEEEVVVEDVIEDVEVLEESGGIEVGEDFYLGDYKMTITDLSISKDYEGKGALLITYDWENGSEENASPFMTFDVKAYQDGVETDRVMMVEGEDLSVGQKEVKSGGVIGGATKAVGIEDMDKPLELEFKEIFSFSGEVITLEVDLSSLQ